MKRGLAAVIAALLLMSGAGAAGARILDASSVQGAVGAATGELTPDGKAAFADVRNCLSSSESPTLNVYYLIDASGSLFASDPTTGGSDPEFTRAAILENSVSQLAELTGVNVSIAAGFFGSRFRDGLEWTSLGSGAERAAEVATKLAKQVRDQEKLGATNWALGITRAQESLQRQQAATGQSGCQMLVWFTDGGINLGDARATNDAINSLCGRAIEATGATPTGTGEFNALRQSGVIVVGVLLRGELTEEDKQRVPYMRPLVEGIGPVDGANQSCGEYPIPESYVHGVLLEASDVDQLAREFMGLGASVNGGFPLPFNSDGTFAIDRGVVRFVFVTSAEKWELRTPTGESLSAADSRVSTIGGATRISVDITPADVGTWSVSSGAQASDLFVYSGLAIHFDEANAIVAGSPATISGTIKQTAQGRNLDLSDYEFELTLESPTVTSQPGEVSIDATTGQFQYTVTSDDPVGEIEMTARLQGLKSSPSGTDLAPVSSTQRVSVSVPGQYPRITPSVVALSPLEGSGGVARGTFTATAPTVPGSRGEICFSSHVPTVVSDSELQSRVSTWQWTITDSSGTPLSKKCIEMATGDPDLVFTVMAENPSPANSDVRAELLGTVTSGSETNADINLKVAFEFASTRPLSTAVVFGLLAVLLLLGLLMPLLLLYAILLGTRITGAKNLMRSSMPVVLKPDGSLAGRNGADPMVPEGQFAFMNLSPMGRVRTYVDPDVGTLRVRVPLNPFNEAKFEVVASAGRYVFSATQTARHEQGWRYADGRRTVFSGDLGTLWVLVVRENDLLGADSAADIPATLVVYLDAERTSPAERMIDVLGRINLRSRVLAARESLEARLAAAQQRRGATGSATPAAPGQRVSSGSSVGDAPPVRRTGTADEPPPLPRRTGGDVPPPVQRRAGGAGSPPPSPSQYPEPPAPPSPRR